MNCADVRDEFSALLDGELEPETRERVERHLAECTECLRELGKLKELDELYRTLPRESAPEDLESRIHAALRLDSNIVRLRRPRFERRSLWPMLAAAAVLVIVMGAVVYQFGRPSRFEMASLKETSEQPAAEAEAAIRMRVTEDMEDKHSEALGGVRSSPEPLVSAEAQTLSEESIGKDEALAKAGELAQQSGLDKPVTGKLPERQLSDQSATARQPEPPAPSASPMRKDFDRMAGLKEAPGRVPPAPESPQAAAMPRDEGRAQLDGRRREAPASQGTPAQAAPPVLGAIPHAAAKPKAAPPVEAEERVSSSTGSLERDLQVAPGKVVAGRQFQFREGTWYESGYTDEPLTGIRRGSEELRQLIANHDDLPGILELGERVVCRLDGEWYRIEPAAE